MCARIGPAGAADASSPQTTAANVANRLAAIDSTWCSSVHVCMRVRVRMCTRLCAMHPIVRDSSCYKYMCGHVFRYTYLMDRWMYARHTHTHTHTGHVGGADGVGTLQTLGMNAVGSQRASGVEGISALAGLGILGGHASVCEYSYTCILACPHKGKREG